MTCESTARSAGVRVEALATAGPSGGLHGGSWEGKAAPGEARVSWDAGAGCDPRGQAGGS